MRRTEKTHNLKTWTECYNAIVENRKTFEIRFNDRNFAVGDRLCLRQWCPINEGYTGRECIVKVSYLLEGEEAERFGVASGFCIMGFDRPYDHRHDFVVCEGCQHFDGEKTEAAYSKVHRIWFIAPESYSDDEWGWRCLDNSRCPSFVSRIEAGKENAA